RLVIPRSICDEEPASGRSNNSRSPARARDNTFGGLMRRLALPILILATVIVAAALAWFTLTHVAGGGGTDMTTEIRAVNPFHRLEISGRADVSLVEGPSESVTIDATARGQPRVLARVEGGTLMI